MNQQSQVQSQAQTQAQLAHLREQNSILNQQLASQAQSHIQHLQQLLPFHQPSSTPPPTPSTYIKPPDRNQCVWIRWCAFHYVLPFCSFCLLATLPPPAGHHRVALSISAPVNKNHCAFHPSAITIAISACAFQSVHSTHRQSTVTISACVSNIRVNNHSSLCIPPATIRTCAFYFYTSERKSFLQSTQSPT